MLNAFVVSVANKPVVLSVVMLSVFILSFVTLNVTKLFKCIVYGC
jgi:hypothetical protein